MEDFLAGAIFILSLLSLIIYHYSKEKSFLYYGLYSALVFTYLFLRVIEPGIPGFKNFITSPTFGIFNWFIQIIYYCLYFFFYIHFMDIQKNLPKFYNPLKFSVNGLIGISSLFYIYCSLTSDYPLFLNYFTFFFIPIILILVVLTVIKALKIPGKLKYFITFGCSTYVLLALTSMYFTLNPEQFAFLILFFLIGLLIEHTVFSFGLAYKVQLLYNKTIIYFKENERLRSIQNLQLTQELKIKDVKISEITEKAEEDRLAKLESDFKSEIHRLQMEILKNQMNPHFIFNALTSIKVFLIENDTKNAVYYLNKFSKLIRKMLDSYRTEYHSLTEEFEILKLYLSIENIRFNSEIEILFQVADKVNTDQIIIPPLLLQPFAENAIWHGLTPKTDGPKQIIVKCFNQNGIPIIEIEDNGIGRKKSSEIKQQKTIKKQSIGLNLIQERIDFFNQQHHFHYSFQIFDLLDEKNQNRGTRISIHLKTNQPTIQ